MLNGKGYTPSALLDLFEKGLSHEKEETNLRLITGYANKLYWSYITPPERMKRSAALEKNLWSAMLQQGPVNNKKILFDAYHGIYLSKETANRIYTIWQTQTAPDGIKLAEEDYTTLASHTGAQKRYSHTHIAKAADTNTKRRPQKTDRLSDPGAIG